VEVAAVEVLTACGELRFCQLVLHALAEQGERDRTRQGGALPVGAESMALATHIMCEHWSLDS
jgi:hypothetical protein